MRILITGGDGNLATSCCNTINNFDVCNTTTKNCTHHAIKLSKCFLDITSELMVNNVLDIYNPDMIINCAAKTNVDECEVNFIKSHETNYIGPVNLAKWVKKHNKHLIQVSTDFVYGDSPDTKSIYHHTEQDTNFSPLNVYGKHKLQAELEIADKTVTIVRTGSLYDCIGASFFRSLENKHNSLGTDTSPMCVTHQQTCSPTWTYRLAMQIYKIACSKKEIDISGVYHAVGNGFVNKFDLAKLFFKMRKINRDVVSVEKIKETARRPKFNILANKRLTDEGISVMLDWKSDVVDVLRYFKGGC